MIDSTNQFFEGFQFRAQPTTVAHLLLVYVDRRRCQRRTTVPILFGHPAAGLGPESCVLRLLTRTVSCFLLSHILQRLGMFIVVSLRLVKFPQTASLY